MSSGVITMSKRAAVGDIINGGQAELLDLMRAVQGRLSRAELLARSAMSRTMLNRHLLELVECELVDFAKAIAAAFASPQIPTEIFLTNPSILLSASI